MPRTRVRQRVALAAKPSDDLPRSSGLAVCIHIFPDTRCVRIFPCASDTCDAMSARKMNNAACSNVAQMSWRHGQGQLANPENRPALIFSSCHGPRGVAEACVINAPHYSGKNLRMCNRTGPILVSEVWFLLMLSRKSPNSSSESECLR
jgi:hypothetical protein